MSNIKRYAIDMYGEDWTERLEDIALKREAKKCRK